MTREEIIQKAEGFTIPEDDLASRHQKSDEFRRTFPIDRLLVLTPEEYCSVGNRDSFLYWVEHRVPGFGIGGGNASKFGIFQGADRKFYTGIRATKRELVGPDLEREFRALMQKLVDAGTLVEENRVDEIAALNIPIWSMVLTKILSLYFPDKFLKIGQKDVLINCGRDLGIDENQLNTENLVYLNWLCRKKLGELDVFRDWDDEYFGAYIWKLYYPWKDEPGTVAPPIATAIGSVESALNTILYGPPGTGKTYNSIDKAVEIIDGSSSGHAVNKARFDELRQHGQIEFVTFHQNYAYEDFMVGIRPDVDHEQLRFQPQKGIFYQIVKKARDNFEAFVSGKGKKRSFDDVFEELIKPLETGEEVPIVMASGIAFRITEVSEKSISFTKKSGGRDHTLSISTLRDIVDGVRDVPGGLNSYYLPLVKLINEKRETKEKAEPRRNFVLIIDEINRANISKVFGELITLLEVDKRLGEGNELRVTLPNGERDFVIPPNLYVIGTMNTADKSIALIDIALRRRFDFIGYYPRPEKLSDERAELLRAINARIFEKKKSADYLIGHAYFMGEAEIDSILRKKIIPLLTEYFAGKTEIVSEIFTSTAWSVEYNTDSFEWDISER